MDGKIDISVGHGTGNLSTGRVKLDTQRVVAPFVRDSAMTSGMRRPGTGTTACIGMYPDINGRFYSDRVQHEPGTLLLLTAVRSRKVVTAAQGAVLLRLRPGAAVIVVKARLPASTENYLGSHFCMFSGPADVLSVEEAEILGLRIPARYQECFFNMEEIAECFDISEVSPETARRPELSVVATPTGTVIRETAPEPARRIRLRK